MADSPTTRNRLRKQEVGAKTNAWGTDWNEDGGSDRLDEAMDGVVAFALSGTKTLTSTNYETDEARMRIINVTGGTGGTVTIPAVEKWYHIRNGASGDVTVSNGSNSITVAAGEVVSFITNGTTIYSLNAKGYVDAAILSASLSASLPSQTGNAGKYITTDGTTASWAGIAVDAVTGTLAAANGGTGLTTYTVGDTIFASGVNTLSALAGVATGNALLSGGVGVAPSWGQIGLTTHVTGTLPVANGGTGITALGTGVATFLGTPSSVNLKDAVTDETGSGALVFATSPTLVTPVLGTPSSGTLTSCTGLPISTGVSGLGTGVATALAVNVGSAGAFTTFNGALGTPSSGTLTNCTFPTLNQNTTGTAAGLSATLAVGSGGTGQTSYTNGQLLIGNTTGNTLTKATLTAGSGISITNGTGTITVATAVPQSESANGMFIGTGAAGSAGSLNVSIGPNAGAALAATSASNLMIGVRAGEDVTTGDYNLAIGQDALAAVTTGSGNIAIGYLAAQTFGASSASNTVIGYLAADSVTANPLSNTIIGEQALTAASTPVGNSNTIVGGQSAAGSASIGAGNTFIGASSGYSCTGASDTLVGKDAGSSLTSGGTNTLVGAYTGSAGLAGNVAMSTGAGTRRFWHDGTDAYVSHATTASAANAFLDSGTSALKRSTSSMRYKRDAEPMDYKFAEAVLALDPIWYRSKCAGDDPGHSFWGFSAEQAAEIDPRLVFWEYAPEDYGEPDKNNERWPKEGAVKVPGGFSYDRLTVHLLAIAKKQRAQIRDLKDANAAFEARLAALEAKLG